MVTEDKSNCLGPKRPILKALQEMLCQLCQQMLILTVALSRLLAAGFAATAAIVDANIVDTPESEVAPAAPSLNISADVDEMKVQRGLAAPSPDGSPADIDPNDAERAQLQAQLDALLAEQHAMAAKHAMELAMERAVAAAAAADARGEADRITAASQTPTDHKAHATAVPTPLLDWAPTATAAGTLTASLNQSCLAPAPKAPPLAGTALALAPLAGTALALVDVSGPFIDEQGVYNELVHTGQKVYAGVVTDGDRKWLSFTGTDGKEELVQLSEGEVTDDDGDDGSDDHPSHGTPMYVDHNTQLPYETVFTGDKKYKRLIDTENNNYYDVTDSDQSFSDDDHG